MATAPGGTEDGPPEHIPETDDWPELVSTALLGTDRRTPPGADQAADPATALLERAAVAAVRRRAGLRPAECAARPEPAPRDPRPPLPTAAARRLARFLADRAGGTAGGGVRQASAAATAELLPQWLIAANAYGYRPPASLLPAVLDAARARTDLRAEAVALAGPRGRWLAGLNPDWAFVLRAGDHATAGGAAARGAAADPGAARRLWAEGLFAERLAVLSGLRTRDPAAGLDLLRSTWSGERAEDRLLFLESLRTGLGPGDEPFLEQALDDRSRNVRLAAAESLYRLPGSALAGRMARRAAGCVSLDRTGVGPRVAVTAPAECDAAMERDGVVSTPPAGRGRRAWWLGQLVAATPLARWPDRLGGRSPAEIIALPVADDWRSELHAAWSRAAVRQRHPAWARALLGRPGSAAGPAVAGDPARLLAVLPAAERAGWVAGFVAAHGLSEAFPLLNACDVPWAEPLGRAVVDALDIARVAGSYPWSFSGVMGLAERSLDPADAIRLEPLAAMPEDPPDASPGAGAYWSEAFQRLVATLRLRATMHAELTPP